MSSVTTPALPSNPKHTRNNMKPSSLIPLNKDIAVSPRLYKSLSRFARIAGLSLEDFLKTNYESEVRCSKEEVQATIRAKKAGLTREEYQTLQLEKAKKLLFPESS